MQPGYFTRWKPDSPAAAWYTFCLFHKKIHVVDFFVKKIENLLPCRRRCPPPNPGSPAVWQHWPFALFAYFVVFVVQTPIA